MNSSSDAYAVLDDPKILSYLFHPRSENPWRRAESNREDFLIPVGGGVKIGASFYFLSQSAPVLLFFHGNGEIVTDYDALAPMFNEAGVNFFVADYRGYGCSGGQPGVKAMIDDSHGIADFLFDLVKDRKLSGGVSVMGRSLGSASAIELAAQRSSDFKSLIVESGFAWIAPLLKILGIDPDGMDLTGLKGQENVDKIKKVTIPALFIHAQFDHIINYSEGQALHDACGSENKYLLQIAGANHNDIFMKGRESYFEQLEKFCR